MLSVLVGTGWFVLSSHWRNSTCARGGRQLLEKATCDKVVGLIPLWALHLKVGLDGF